MIYGDEENKRWWEGLTHPERMEILGTMADKAHSPEFALSLAKWYEDGKRFSPKQLAAIRKWEPRYR